MSLTSRQLLRKPSKELDAIFAGVPSGPIPAGEATGTAIAWPGSLCARVVAWFARWFLKKLYGDHLEKLKSILNELNQQ